MTESHRADDRATPPANAIAQAIEAARASPCAKSKRGAAIWRKRTEYRALANHFADVCSSGHNAPPRGHACDGSGTCRSDCGKICEHAEAAAIRTLTWTGRGFEMLHIKVVDGEPVPSGPPSCWQCSKLILTDERIAAVWLLHEDGWRRYSSVDFHAATLATCGLHGGGGS